MKNETEITYAEAAVMFKAANLSSSQRFVRGKIALHPKLCPVQSYSYHTKRMRVSDVKRLMAHLVNHSRMVKKTYPGDMLHGAPARKGKR